MATKWAKGRSVQLPIKASWRLETDSECTAIKELGEKNVYDVKHVALQAGLDIGVDKNNGTDW